MVISLGAYLAILSALALERVFHLVIASRNARRAFAMGAVEHGRGHYPLMAAFHALFLVSAAAEAIVFKRPFPGTLGWIALGGALGAQALRYWSVVTLGPGWNTRIIVFPGMPPISRGPYRFMRHPNYLAVIVEIACVPLIRGCWLTAVVFSIGNAILLWVRIRAEEAAMGPRYALEFGSRLRLVPKLPPRPVQRESGGKARCTTPVEAARWCPDEKRAVHERWVRNRFSFFVGAARERPCLCLAFLRSDPPSEKTELKLTMS